MAENIQPHCYRYICTQANMYIYNVQYSSPIFLSPLPSIFQFFLHLPMLPPHTLPQLLNRLLPRNTSPNRNLSASARGPLLSLEQKYHPEYLPTKIGGIPMAERWGRVGGIPLSASGTLLPLVFSSQELQSNA